MQQIRQNISLQPLNTFGMNVTSDYFFELHSVEDFDWLMQQAEYRQQKKLILGGGSNILFTDNFHGLVIRDMLKGITVKEENEDHVIVEVASGEIWHELVKWAVERGYGGLENLSLIPGCVGASPMQNIGAYGVEMKDLFVSLETIDMQSGNKKTFDKAECQFGYRDSVFKQKYKDRYLITSVTFRLSKKHKPNTSYGAINEELKKAGVTDPGIRDVSDAVIRIRRSKLPDPAETGNAGSFFKNPEVETAKYEALKAKYSDLVAYPMDGKKFKLAAGWMIEKCGLKGRELNGAAVHTKQALVIINKHPETTRGKDVYDLSEQVLQSVAEKFGVLLEREVNIV
jgi:UDP-N-acetylmuramate dehydrogenase